MAEEIIIRLAKEEDKEEIWSWWNDPVTRTMMKRNDYVPWEEHCNWYKGVLNDSDRILCIGIYNKKKTGVLRFDSNGEGIYEVSINLNPEMRGKKLGYKIMVKAIDYLREIKRPVKLFASLKKANIASKKTFEKAGFIFIDNPKINHTGLERFELGKEIYCELHIVKHDQLVSTNFPTRDRCAWEKCDR